MFFYNLLALRTAGKELCYRALDNPKLFSHPAFLEAAEKLEQLKADLEAYKRNASEES